MLYFGTLVFSASERGEMLNRYLHGHRKGRDEQQGSVGMKEFKSALSERIKEVRQVNTSTLRLDPCEEGSSRVTTRDIFDQICPS